MLGIANSKVIGGPGIWTPGATRIGPNFRNLTALIRKIFTGGVQGFAYDPNDLTTLYQDAAGTIPVTAAGQPVGLMLDKSKGLALGLELSSYSAGFSSLTGISPVGATLSLKGTALVITAQAGIARRAEIPVGGLTVGKFYRISFKAYKSSFGSGQHFEQFTAFTKTGYSAGVTSTSSTEYSFILEATAVSGVLRAYAANIEAIGAQVIVESVSVKELLGNHAYQTVSASRPILQQTPILGSELVVNSTFDTGTSGWEGSNGGQLLAVNGGMRLTNTLAAYGRAGCTIPSITGKSYKISCRLRSGGGTSVTLGVGNNSGSVALGSVYTASTEYVNTSFIFTAQAETTFIIGLIGTTTVGLTAFFDDISVKEIVGYRTDQNYLAFDGVDDFLQTNSINFTVTDKVSLFAGVRKLSDAATAILAELSSDTNLNNGAFYIAAPISASPTISFASKGTLNARTDISGYAAPTSIVTTMQGQISTDRNIVRVNGLQKGSTSNDQGTGNYGNYPLYIGRRGGTQLPFNGHIYGLIGIGRLTTDSETIALEKAIAKNTGVTLNA